jgi:hypothetical protein
MGNIQVGERVPVLTIGHTTARGQYVSTATRSQLASVTDENGLVNLEAEPDGCGLPEFHQNLGKQWTVVGTTFVLFNQANQDFRYDNDQSSSVGVGYSASGKDGSFSADGTTSVDTDGGEDWGTLGEGNERYATYFRYGVYETICSTRGGSGYEYYQIKPYEWAAGDQITHPNAPSYHGYNCVPQTHNSTFHKYTSHAIEFSGGYSVFGFTGSTQTGYSTSAEVIMHFYARGRMCGTNDVPGGTDPRVLLAIKY